MPRGSPGCGTRLDRISARACTADDWFLFRFFAVVRAVIPAISLAKILSTANAYCGWFAGLTIATSMWVALISMGCCVCLRRHHLQEQHRANWRGCGIAYCGRRGFHVASVRNHGLQGLRSLHASAQPTQQSRSDRKKSAGWPAGHVVGARRSAFLKAPRQSNESDTVPFVLY